MDKNKVKIEKRMRRRKKIRAKISGNKNIPRFSVFRSLNHIYVQLIDDVNRKTLASANDREIRKDLPAGRQGKREKRDHSKGKVGVALVVGELVAKKALEKGIKQVVFDRGGYKYHGRVKAVSDGARKGGLKF